MAAPDVSRQATQLAISHGAPPEAIDALQTRDTLLKILTEANIEADICEDVADTCDLNNLNALAIASGLLSAEKIAEYCFLTNDEAEVVLTNCAHQAFQAGVTFGRASVVSPRRLGTFRRASPKAVEWARKSPAESPSGPFADGDSLKFDYSPVKTVRTSDDKVSSFAEHSDRAPAVSEWVSPESTQVEHNTPEASERQPEPASALGFSLQSASQVQAVELAQPLAFDSAREESPSANDAIGPSAAQIADAVAPSAINVTQVVEPAAVVDALTESRLSPNIPSVQGSAAPSFTPSEQPVPTPQDPHDAVQGEAVASSFKNNDAEPPAPSLQQSPEEESVPPSALVAPAAAPAERDARHKSKASASGATLRTESGPNSPQTPRDTAGRDMLKVDSDQLNTGSSVPPQRDHSVGTSATNATVPALPSPSPSTPNSSNHGAPQAQLAPQRPATTSSAYPSLVPAPLSTPLTNVNGSVGRIPVPTPLPIASTHTNGEANGVVNGSTSLRSPTAPSGLASLRSPQGSAHLKSPRTTPRPITPPPRSRGRQGQNPNYPSEGLEELGSTFLKYPGVLPSFMRPTAAHEKRRQMADEELAQRTPSPPRRPTRSVNPNAHFIRPTASYSAKASTETTPIARAHSAAPAVRNHTPTTFAPFCLHTEMRLPQRNRKTTDELRLVEARKAKEEEAARRRLQLQRLQKLERARTASPKLPDGPNERRSRGVKPFQLASVARHERDLQVRKEQLQRQLADEARQKQFRARQYNPNQYQETQIQPRPRRSEPGGRRVTTPKAPTFRTDQRLGFKQDALESYFTSAHESAHAKRQIALAREEERKREEAQSAREREFRARPAPKSVGSFRLDATKVKPTTIPKPFNLSSSRVVHSLYYERDPNGVDPPTKLCSPQGVMSEFARSLRAREA